MLVSDNTYGGTFRLFERVRRKFGLDFSYVDTSDLDRLAPAMTPKTKYLFVESPTNPMLSVTDLAAASDIAHRHGVRVVVDNTFASPYIQRPLELGADIVVHSTTKFLNGHSDSVGGVVIVRHADDEEWMRFVQNAAGAILGPMDAWLVLRGTKTRRADGPHQCQRAAAGRVPRGPPEGDAHDLPGPALASAPRAGVTADARLRELISFDTGSLEAARRVLGGVRLMALAESLGGVETLISHPAVMTHASVPADRREALGITDGLIRVSVGIEDVDDLIDDLSQALEG